MYQTSVNLKISTFWDQICQKNMNKKNFEKITVKNKISIYNVPVDQISFNLANVCFCGTKFPKENMNDKNFEKINISMEISRR